MDQALKKIQFQCSLDSPGGWLMNALWLKRAAEEIDFMKHKDTDINSPEGDFRFMISVFKMLMGLSFENLLKGIIVTQKGSAGSSSSVDKDITTHKMPDLIDQSAVPISTEEAVILSDLERYVVWAGRYPFPKREEDIFAKSQSSIEYTLTLSFWDRLYEHLKKVGWIMKGNGSKLWMDPSQH